jgi:RNA polymerase sigma-70 factor (ECF subfamily)
MQMMAHLECRETNVSRSKPVRELPRRDEDLIAEFRSSTQSAAADTLFDEMFRRYHARITAWCFRFTRDQNYAADLAQDVFLKAYRHLDSYRGESSFSTWLYAIARNHCIWSLRNRQREPTEMSEEISPVLADRNAGNAYEVVEREQLSKLLWRTISKALDPLERRVIVLHYLQGMSLPAITATLALGNPSGAKAYIVKARRKLNWALAKRSSRSVSSRRKGQRRGVATP